MIVPKLFSFLILAIHVNGFTSSFGSVTTTKNHVRSFTESIARYETADGNGDEKKPIDIVLSEMHESGFPFRIVVSKEDAFQVLVFSNL